MKRHLKHPGGLCTVHLCSTPFTCPAVLKKMSHSLTTVQGVCGTLVLQALLWVFPTPSSNSEAKNAGFSVLQTERPQRQGLSSFQQHFEQETPVIFKHWSWNYISTEMQVKGIYFYLPISLYSQLTLPAVTKCVSEMSSQKSRVGSFINMSLMAQLLNEGLLKWITALKWTLALRTYNQRTFLLSIL